MLNSEKVQGADLIKLYKKKYTIGGSGREFYQQYPMTGHSGSGYKFKQKKFHLNI